MSLLATNNVVQAVNEAACCWGLFGAGDAEKDKSWKSFSESVTSRIDEKTSIEDINAVLRVFANQNVSIGSLWTDLFEKTVDVKIKAEKVKLGDLVALVHACNAVDFRSDAVISKLVAGLLENETVWTLDPKDLVQVAHVVASSLVQNRQLFAEIGARVSAELSDFEIDQLVSIIEAFATINFTSEDMVKAVVKRAIEEDEWTSMSVLTKVRIADAISRLRFRSDTFFRKLVRDLLMKDAAVSAETVASVCVAMGRLKVNVGSTEWWDRESDYQKLLEMVTTGFVPEPIATMNAKEISNCVQVVKASGKMRISNAVMDRMQNLLTKDPLSRSYRYLALVMEALAKGSDPAAVHVDHLRWVAEWLCGNVYILTVHDIASLNRSLAKLGFRDHNYHKIWIPYYLERIDQLAKDDVSLISDNFNAIGMSDTQMGGRHFFYKLGKRFQELSVDGNGDKEQRDRRKHRNLNRLG